jgi:hypothetical protein
VVESVTVLAIADGNPKVRRAVRVQFHSGGHRDYIIVAKAKHGEKPATWWAKSLASAGVAGEIDLRDRADVAEVERFRAAADLDALFATLEAQRAKFPSNLAMSRVVPFRRRWDLSAQMNREMQRCALEIARTWSAIETGRDEQLVESVGHKNARVGHSAFLHIERLWLSEHLDTLFHRLDDPAQLATTDDFRALAEALQHFGRDIGSLPFGVIRLGYLLTPFESLLNKRPLDARAGDAGPKLQAFLWRHTTRPMRTVAD